MAKTEKITKEKMTMNLEFSTKGVKKWVKIESAKNELHMRDYVSQLLTNEYKKSLKK